MTAQRHAQIVKAVLTSIVVLPMFNHNLSHIYLARATITSYFFNTKE